MFRLALPFLTVLAPAAIAQDGAQQGPAIAFVDAFPAQEEFERPLFVAFHPTDPEMAWVVTQAGQVLRVPRDGSKSDREVVLDFKSRVYRGHNEEGLLGFQFDPGYADNGFVWIYWSEETTPTKGAVAGGREHESNRRSVISRLTVQRGDGDDGTLAVDPATELRVLEVFQPWGNHNGGTILFGPDRMLYIAIGDGGAANDPYGNAESLELLLGKVLRIDVREASAETPYTIPADNPFVDREDARGEIWCYGLRNVWRMAFDRETGELWCGDVGQNLVEEVDHLEKGGFYGWNSFEGKGEFVLRDGRTPTPPDPIPPVAEYGHRDGLSVTGGHVYRGSALRALRGFYVYGDFVTRRMWAVDTTGEHTVVDLAPAPLQPSSFAEEPEGELLMTGYAGDKGRIFRVVPAQD
ncbi:MAG: PQQ-dependent sugar dehydrogenase [Planctomycetes bacterium]|nr:PQQ-dependent sugar dehydrogenase [Planctomycetota bacterium]